MKRILSVILSAVMLCGVLRFPVYAVENVADGEIKNSARACALYCVNNGDFLYTQNADERLPMASTTKILTALITLEEAARDNRAVTFTEEMTAEGSSMYLEVGERVRLYDLAVGMLMQSGNDAANAAAIALSGSLEAFAERMNARARELGMNHSSFVTPSGLDAENHYTTARDMAVLMAAAMENDSFKEITKQTAMDVSFVSPAEKTVTCPNHNRLLTMYDGCIGGKTGYTDRAGRCLVTCAERDGLRLVAVTLDDPDDWDDHMRLYDDGFGKYDVISPDAAPLSAPVVGGNTDTVRVTIPAGQTIVIPKDKADRVKTTVYLPAFLYAPAEKGKTVGRLVYTADGDVLAEVPLAAAETVKNDRPRGIVEYIKDVLHWHSW
jgi:D-alanyl-D-alanine carboxypeptidase/D-alanyl-D-alanine carboxypeptidase (penicillin-binding protein 5/6)